MTEELLKEMFDIANNVRANAYVPYSKFRVGAAVLGESGKIYSGCNVENASYGLCNCGERTAIFKAVSEGETKFKAIVVVADCPQPCPPCGACRQVIAEFLIPVTYSYNVKGDCRKQTLDELLPFYFSGADFIK